MITTHVLPDNSRPPYRAARVWVKRNGQWQMVDQRADRSQNAELIVMPGHT